MTPDHMKRKTLTMKLRNLLLTAALFLSSAVAFAAPKATKDYDDYSWLNESGMRTIKVTLNQLSANQNGFSYAVYDVDALARITKEVYEDDSIKSNKKEKEIENRMKSYIWVLNEAKGANATSDTFISLDKDNTEVRFGVIEYNGQPKNVNVSSVPNISKNGFHFYTLSEDPNNVVYYGKTGTGENGTGNDKSAQIIFGAPLPTPVVTLLIALAFGTGFMMYRNRKQAKA